MIKLKNIKQFKGHEGEPLMQGNIYIDDKKAGEWSDDFNGGSMSFSFSNKEDKNKFIEYGKKILTQYQQYDGSAYDVSNMKEYEIIDEVLYHLSMQETERLDIKKHVKKGIVYFRKDNNIDGKTMYVWKAPYTKENVQKLKNEYADLLSIGNETLQLPYEDIQAYQLSEKNKQYKKYCKNNALFLIKEVDGIIKEMISKTAYSATLANYIRTKYPDLIE